MNTPEAIFSQYFAALQARFGERIKDYLFPPPVFAAMQGELVRLDLENGSLTARFPVLESYLNPYGAMQGGMMLLKPTLGTAGPPAGPRVLLGTVQGDLHDIGKSLVGMMLEGAGFSVHDLGTDVAPRRFAEAVEELRPAVVGLSSLLTTTMPQMQVTLDALEEAGLRQGVRVILGGAPVTEAFARTIGADGSAPDASRAVALVRSLLTS